MPDQQIPCYGGPFDGRFYSIARVPSGYKKITIKAIPLYVWQDIKLNAADFNILHRAAKKKPSDYRDEKSEH